MNLFLDTSVILAACGSSTGASREIFERASRNGWTLLATPYVVDEVLHNLSDIPLLDPNMWRHLHSQLVIRETVLTLDRIAVFEPAKDRPILYSAFAYAEILLTLDVEDFGVLLNQPFYHLLILRPGAFLREQRTRGTLL